MVYACIAEIVGSGVEDGVFIYFEAGCGDLGGGAFD